MFEVSAETDESLTLDEYIRFCREEQKYFDVDEMIANRAKLKALCNNPHFFADYLSKQLKQPDQFQVDNAYAPPVFVLHVGQRFGVRAVVWLPERELSTVQLLSYREAHDHDFSFLTCGYYDPGYKTESYEYDGRFCVGFEGESVDMIDTGIRHLSPGTLMLYRANIDIHAQIPPPDLSVSINYILLGEK